ncbi:MAG: hypothetical protein IJ186_01590 [Bacilli bacterium]|nr:hypothetical protein [Bacilli bacterium]
MTKKCTHCGSTKLRIRDYSFTDTADNSFPIDIYVCEECGHIELFENNSNSFNPYSTGDGKIAY